MTPTEKLAKRVKQRDVKISTLSYRLDIPYKRLYRGLRGMGNMRFDDGVKLCKYLKLDVKDLEGD